MKEEDDNDEIKTNTNTNNNKSKNKFKIEIKLNKIRYFPGEKIDGFIKVHSNDSDDFSNILESTDFNYMFTEKIIQISPKSCMKSYNLDERIIPCENFQNLDTSKDIQIPITYTLPDSLTLKFYPSFRYYSYEMKCLIIHSLSVEIPFLSNKTGVNIFIKKPKEEIKKNKNENKENNENHEKIDELNNCVFKDEFVKKVLKNKGRLTYLIKTKKSIGYKEQLPVEVHINLTELKDIKISSCTFQLKKSIYLYDSDGYYFGEFFEKSYDIKKLDIKSGDKNYTIKELLTLPNTEFSPLTNEDILKPKIKDGKANFTPPVKTELFSAFYELIVKINIKDTFVKDKKEVLQIDFHEPNLEQPKQEEEGEIMEKNAIINPDIDVIGAINDFNLDGDDEDDINKEFERESSFVENKKKEEKDLIGFELITNEDFMNLLNNKNIKK